MGKKINYFLGLVSGVALAVIVWVAYGHLIEGRIAVGSPQYGASVAAEGEASMDFEAISAKLYHIYRILESEFIGDFDLELAIEMMFAGFVEAAGDPYTRYMDAAAFSNFRQEVDGTFIGIGVSVVVDPADNRIMVIAPFEGSPAEEAGIVPGDKIIRVNDFEVSGDILQEAINMIRGEAGTEVLITILRQSDNTIHEFTIVREVIQVETVRSDILDDNIGYIRISQFDRVTFDQFSRAYDRLIGEGVEGLIIDVRNNPGGLLAIVNRITNLLVPEGIITFTENAHGARNYVRSDANHIQIPLVVLVNGNSASASEILAGAVRDTGVGELLGTTTFGKGLVQNVFDLPDGSGVKVTIARYFTPAGICIHGEGIVPNHYVEMSTELTNNLSRLSVEEDIQLQEAINLVNEMIDNN